MRCSRTRSTSYLVPVAWLCAALGAAADVMEELELSCGGELGCGELEPPPDFLRLVPPPPVPEFMEEYVQRLHQGSGECLLCNWAHNDSLLLVGGESTSSSWIPILVVVALLSALLGAVAMVVIIRCRRWRVLPSKGLCPLVAMERPKETAPPVPSSKPPGGRGGAAVAASASRMRLWPRGGAGLHSPDSGGDSEAGYVEQPYTFPDQESAVYAELNSVASQGAPACRTYLMNTYSEIGEPRRLLPDGTYENAGYLLEPAGESAGSAGSAHSSAYYSDVSAAP
ncbi:uncharacterized protein LOC119094107 [Pollicipes pollicipes]|uniref:uncharacterized protein LOC119094107 n=1 Tax=Pollicipes pollicipes TaxID=41117 RepID=UPI0018849A53|nr:uncharacterized protein LOC119094107 [Pollicipes pollicipes]